MDNTRFIKLCSRAWTLPILAVMQRDGIGRVSPLAHRLRAGRTAVTASVLWLEELGLIARNTGHGHPLRPEILLTKEGREVGAWASELLNEISAPEDFSLIRKSWTLPVLRATTNDGQYAAIRRTLQPITDRALSLSLKNITQRGWMTRHVDTEQTPLSVHYALAGRAASLAPHLTQSWRLMSG